MNNNKQLHKANKEKKDEWYTKYNDIEKELKNYSFINKKVYCNCDDYKKSNFWKYFYDNFNNIKLKQLISTCYDPKNNTSIITIYDGKEIKHIINNNNGDYKENILILKYSDIVVTNPPFSEFLPYISLLIKENKEFIILGCQTAIGYKEIFSEIKGNRIRTGYTYGEMDFIVPNDYEPREKRYREENGIKYRSLGNACWYTNIEIKEKEFVKLTENYEPEKYSKYDNYNAININKITEIPYNYYGIMGVPITFMHKYNQNQFEIIGFRKGNDGKDLRINGRDCFLRVLIRRKNCIKR